MELLFETRFFPECEGGGEGVLKTLHEFNLYGLLHKFDKLKVINLDLWASIYNTFKMLRKKETPYVNPS
jgi:hypothetical protein